MTVYIEYVILDNFIIDYIILYAAAKTLKLRAKWYVLALSAALGTALAVILPVLKLDSTLQLILKLSTGILMTAPLSGFKLKKFLLVYLLFVTYTFVLGGCMLGVLFFMEADIYSAATLQYSAKVPVGVIAGGCFAYYLVLAKLIKYLNRKKNVYPFIRRIVLCYNDGEFEADGFIDSGNRLYDCDGSPIMLVSMNLARRMISDEVLNNLITGTYSGSEFRKKDFSTAQSRKSCMFLFKIVRLKIYPKDKPHIIDNVSVGMVTGGFRGIEGCDALLHTDLLEG